MGSTLFIFHDEVASVSASATEDQFGEFFDARPGFLSRPRFFHDGTAQIGRDAATRGYACVVSQALPGGIPRRALL